MKHHLLLLSLLIILLLLLLETVSSFASAAPRNTKKQQLQTEESRNNDNNDAEEQLQWDSIPPPENPSWQWCINNIGRFYLPTGSSSSSPNRVLEWTAEGERLCGFKKITPDLLNREAFFHDRSNGMVRHTFVGDSTALRAYASAVNEFMPPNRVEVGKVRQSPLHMLTQISDTNRIAVMQNFSASDSSSPSPSPSSSASASSPRRQKSAAGLAAAAAADENKDEESPAADSPPPPPSPDAAATSDDQKTAAVPRSSSSSSSPQSSSSSSTKKTKFAQMRFSRLVHVSLWSHSMNWTLSQLTGAGLISFSLGNWDLNWRLQPDYTIPGLRRRNYGSAQQYWSKYVQELFDRLDRELSSSSSSKRNPRSSSPPPIVIVKEQLLPNCNAHRFAPKKQGGKGKPFNRRCEDQVRPIIVPMYRRVLAAAAWSRNVPVVPMDHLLAHRLPYCQVGDGIHLDRSCMTHEQQLIWNAYLLMLRRGVKQGRGDRKLIPVVVTNPPAAASSGSGADSTGGTTSVPTYRYDAAELAAQYALNETLFNAWWCRRPWQPACDRKGRPILPKTSSTFAPPTTTASSSSFGDKPTTNKKSSSSSSSTKRKKNNDRDNKNNDDDGPLVLLDGKQQQRNAYTAPPLSGIDILTMALIVVVPVVTYVLLRSVSTTTGSSS